MVYKFRQGARIKTDAQIAGVELERLEADGNLTAKALVDASRPADAPLHKEFEWDDSKAAESYREMQARHIINSIEIVREEASPIRAFFNLERTESQYHHVDLIMRKEETRKKLLMNALAELKAFERKYSQLKELAAVFEAIDNLGEAST